MLEGDVPSKGSQKVDMVYVSYASGSSTWLILLLRFFCSIYSSLFVPCDADSCKDSCEALVALVVNVLVCGVITMRKKRSIREEEALLHVWWVTKTAHENNKNKSNFPTTALQYTIDWTHGD